MSKNIKIVCLFICELCHEVMVNYRTKEHSVIKHDDKATFLREIYLGVDKK